MIDFLVMQIRLGRITLEQVPEKYRESVELKLSNKEEE